jgi:hypothetical protein
MGNQMFQVAYGLSKGCRTFDISSFDNDTLRHYEMDQWDLDIELVRDPNAEAGYWQDEKYFDAPLVRKIFANPKWPPSPECLRFARWKIQDAENSCFIGIRRADYLWPERINYHGVLSIDYYREAIWRMPFGTRFFVFTDDIPWATENLCPLAKIVDVNGPNEKAWDIWLMSLCKSAIIANSTFHFWGAWLQNDTGTVITPKRWYADEKVNAECTIVPGRWIKI